MFTQTERGKKAEEYLIRYPKLPTMTLARLLYSENDGMYKDAMHARDILRNYRGEKNKKRDFGSRGGKQGQYALVSDSVADSWEKYVLPKSANIIERKLELKKRIRATKDTEEKQRLRQDLANIEIEEISNNEPGKYCTGWFGQRKY